MERNQAPEVSEAWRKGDAKSKETRADKEFLESLKSREVHFMVRHAIMARPSKAGAILDLLRRGISLNRYEAERHGDHCLNSTIAELRNHYHQPIQSRWETVPNRLGRLTRVKRYWMATSNQAGPDAGQEAGI